MNWRDPKFRYVPVRQMKPGYLAAKFKRIQREQAEKNEAERVAKVQPLRKVAR